MEDVPVSDDSGVVYSGRDTAASSLLSDSLRLSFSCCSHTSPLLVLENNGPFALHLLRVYHCIIGVKVIMSDIKIVMLRVAQYLNKM